MSGVDITHGAKMALAIVKAVMKEIRWSNAELLQEV